MTKKKNLITAASEYEVGEWAGSPHYKCKRCQFDTLIGLDVMLTHLVERHSSEAALNTLFPNAPKDNPVNDVEIKEIENGTNNIN